MLTSDVRLLEVANCLAALGKLDRQNLPKVPLPLKEVIYALSKTEVQKEKTSRRSTSKNRSPQSAATNGNGSLGDLPFATSQTGVVETSANGESKASISERDTLLPPSGDDAVSLEQMAQRARKKSLQRTAALVVLLVFLVGFSFWLGYQKGNQTPRLAGFKGKGPQFGNVEPDNDGKQGNDADDDSSSSSPENENRPNASDPTKDHSSTRDVTNNDPQGGTTSDTNSEQGTTSEQGATGSTDSANTSPDTDPSSTADNSTSDPSPQPIIVPVPTTNEDKQAPTTLPPSPSIAWEGIIRSPNPQDNNEPPKDPPPQVAEQTPTEASPQDPVVAEEEVNKDLAFVVDKKSQLYRYDAKRNDWFQVASDAPIRSQERLFVLAGTQATLALGKNATVQITGPASCSLAPENEDQVPLIDLEYGRLQIINQVDDLKVDIRFGDRVGRLHIPFAKSETSVERVYMVLPGTDPIASVTEYQTVTLHQKSSLWQMEGQNHRLDAGMAWSQQSNAPAKHGVLRGPMILEQIEQKWQLQINPVANVLDADSGLIKQLVSSIQDNRREIRASAVSSLASLANFEHFIKFLQNKSNRNEWRRVIEKVRFYAVNGRTLPSATIEADEASQETNSYAHTLRETVNADAPRNVDMYELLLGYSQAQLDAGKAGRLVDLLEDRLLEVRVLAISQLNHITTITLGYRPEKSERDRRRSIEKWHKRLEKSGINYTKAPQLPQINIAQIVQGDQGEEQSQSEGEIQNLARIAKPK